MEPMDRQSHSCCAAAVGPLGTALPSPSSGPGGKTPKPLSLRPPSGEFDVIVLRLLGGTPEVEGGPLAGGEVTYLAECADRHRPSQSGLASTGFDALDDHPLRMRGRGQGSDDDLAWATWRLEESGLGLTGPPAQVRSWNLSSIWRLATTRGTVWIKVVPDFFAHEASCRAGRALAVTGRARIAASEGNRMLIADVPGEDLYDVGSPPCRDGPVLVDTQVAMGDRSTSLPPGRLRLAHP